MPDTNHPKPLPVITEDSRPFWEDAGRENCSYNTAMPATVTSSTHACFVCNVASVACAGSRPVGAA